MKSDTQSKQLLVKENRVINFYIKYKVQIIISLLFAAHIFLRFYLLFQRANFGWDQVDSAWGAKSILIDKHFLLNGPVAKGNSGIYMGSLYYYLISTVYFFTHLDPIASPIFQSLLSIINASILYFVTKKLFNTKVALIAVFINTFSLAVMNADQVQSAFYLIVPVSYLIFYTLYKCITGEIKYIPLLGVFLGVSFHVDFTSVFYPILILISLPFFPRTKKTIFSLLLSLPIFLIFLLPTFVIELTSKHATSNNLVYLFHSSYHGFHLKRAWQLIHDAFLSFEQILQFRFFRPVVFFVLPLFMILYSLNKKDHKKDFKLFYLMIIWILIPWFILSTYSGELTDYYFSLPRDIAIAVLAYITLFLYQRKQVVFKLIPIIFFSIYAFSSLQMFFNYKNGNLLGIEAGVKQTIAEKKIIPFADHKPESYVYYVYTRNSQKKK